MLHALCESGDEEGCVMSGGDDDVLFGLVLRGRAVGSLLQTLSDRWPSFCSLLDRNTLSCFLIQQTKIIASNLQLAGPEKGSVRPLDVF
ncbi:hypothetical protein SRHO_G00220160 [Serrasalmus rhombeus]